MSSTTTIGGKTRLVLLRGQQWVATRRAVSTLRQSSPLVTSTLGRSLAANTDPWLHFLSADTRRPVTLAYSKYHTSQSQSSSLCFSTPVDMSEDELQPHQLPIRILYASQGGTAQIFAQQLAEALEEHYAQIGVDTQVTIEGCHESKPPKLLTPGEALHVFLVSVTGVGEPPDNGRAFYEWIQSKDATGKDFSNLNYTVFGLGNSKAHPNHYNTIGIHLDKRLE